MSDNFIASALKLYHFLLMNFVLENIATSRFSTIYSRYLTIFKLIQISDLPCQINIHERNDPKTLFNFAEINNARNLNAGI
jgi:hypothetical protein